jgi:hypothetical protein
MRKAFTWLHQRCTGIDQNGFDETHFSISARNELA